MPGLPVTFQLGTFPVNYCFTSLQGYANDLVALLTGTVQSGFASLVIGPNLPAPNQQSSLWIKVDAYGNPIGWFIFQGQWVQPHPISPSSKFRTIYTGTPNQLWLEDGGDGTDPSTNPPTPTSGSFWQVDTAFNFAIPMGAGTSPVTYDGNPATVLAVGATLGEERHVLTGNEEAIVPHDHGVGIALTPGKASQYSFAIHNAQDITPAADWENSYSGASGTASKEILSGPAIQPSPTPPVLSHQNLPPVVGVYIVRRTARVYIVGG